MKKIISIVSLSAIVLISCDTRTYDDISQIPGGGGAITYTNTVKGIMTANCTSCHSPYGGNDQPYLTNYAEVKANINTVLSTMQDGSMPPSGKLPASTIQKIQDWKNAGMPE